MRNKSLQTLASAPMLYSGVLTIMLQDYLLFEGLGREYKNENSYYDWLWFFSYQREKVTNVTLSSWQLEIRSYRSVYFPLEVDMNSSSQIPMLPELINPSH
ncbi:hypothetical protein NPIL_511291 [Nephila pilipes]|uniref:Uncharacterized protein n=1 Tax=Nephila pilipes TaxID=299642 RepID=A0A8X6MQR6_NEPPI|nr:hypothetical protein NPIL_511291 [Nephila pilipes]